MILDIQGTMNTQGRQLTPISGDEVGVDGQRKIPKGDAFQSETEVCLCPGQKMRLMSAQCSRIYAERAVCAKPWGQSAGFLGICWDFTGWLDACAEQWKWAG